MKEEFLTRVLLDANYIAPRTITHPLELEEPLLAGSIEELWGATGGEEGTQDFEDEGFIGDGYVFP